MLRSIAVAALTLTLASIAATARADDREDLNAANALVERGERAKGEAGLRALIERLPSPKTAAERDVAARAHFSLGQLADQSRDYASALREYRAVVAVDPSNYYAGNASARVATLERDERSLAELAEVDRIRQDPKLAGDAQEVGSLAKRALGWPRSHARDAALLFAAHSLLGRLGRPDEALGYALEVTRTATDDGIDRPQAFTLAYAAMVETKTIARGGRALADDPRVPHDLRVKILRDLRRLRLHAAALVVMALSAIAAVASGIVAVRGGRVAIVTRALANRSAIAAIVVAAVGGWAIADRWEGGQGRHFLTFGAFLAGAHVLVALLRGALGDRSLRMRAVGGTLAATFVVGAAYLSLERAEAQGVAVLAEFGL